MSAKVEIVVCYMRIWIARIDRILDKNYRNVPSGYVYLLYKVEKLLNHHVILYNSHLNKNDLSSKRFVKMYNDLKRKLMKLNDIYTKKIDTIFNVPNIQRRSETCTMYEPFLIL